MLSEEALEQALGIVGLRLHGNERAGILEEIDRFTHGASRVSVSIEPQPCPKPAAAFSYASSAGST